jgi:hypothetical protein
VTPYRVAPPRPAPIAPSWWVRHEHAFFGWLYVVTGVGYLVEGLYASETLGSALARFLVVAACLYLARANFKRWRS